MSSTAEDYRVATDQNTAVTEETVPRARRERRRLPLSPDRLRSLLGLMSPLALLLLWEAGVHLGLVDYRFFPAPTAILAETWDMLRSGELVRDMGWSLSRIFVGFFGGGFLGLVVGLSMGLFRPVRLLLRPIVSAIYPIPKLALYPLILLVFGISETAMYFTIGLGTFFMVLINTQAGVLNLDKIYLDVAKNYGASRKDYYLKIALPGALPLIFTGIELGMGMALLLIVAAEMVGADAGIGQNIWTARDTFQIEQMFVSFFLIALLGYLFAELLAAIERRVIPWKREG